MKNNEKLELQAYKEMKSKVSAVMQIQVRSRIKI